MIFLNYYLLDYCVMCVYTRVLLWRSDDNVLELVFSFTMWVLEIQLRSSDLAVSTLLILVILVAQDCFKKSIRK